MDGWIHTLEMPDAAPPALSELAPRVNTVKIRILKHSQGVIGNVALRPKPVTELYLSYE